MGAREGESVRTKRVDAIPSSAAIHERAAGSPPCRGGGLSSPPSGQSKDDAGNVTIYFANITRWNARAVEYMTSTSPMASAHVICVVETHLKGPKLTQEVKALHRMGWRTATVPAVEASDAQREGPGLGGVAILS